MNDLRGRKNLLLCDGMEYEGWINRDRIKGRITVNLDGVFLCQDFKNGSGCGDRKGYKYSWYVCDGSNENLIRLGVSDFKLMTVNKSNYGGEVDRKLESSNMQGRHLALKFGEYISEKLLIGDFKPAFPASGEVSEKGFSRMRFDKDGAPEVYEFKTVSQVYEDFLEEIDYHD